MVNELTDSIYTPVSMTGYVFKGWAKEIVNSENVNDGTHC